MDYLPLDAALTMCAIRYDDSYDSSDLKPAPRVTYHHDYKPSVTTGTARFYRQVQVSVLSVTTGTVRF